MDIQLFDDNPGIGSFEYSGINDAATADPTPGKFATNTAGTRIEISNTSSSGLDISSMLAQLVADNHVYLRSEGKDGHYKIVSATARTGYYDLTVTAAEAGSGFALTASKSYSAGLVGGGLAPHAFAGASHTPSTVAQINLNVLQDANIGIVEVGGIPQLVDVGGQPGFPSGIDGSQLDNLPSGSRRTIQNDNDPPLPDNDAVSYGYGLAAADIPGLYTLISVAADQLNHNLLINAAGLTNDHGAIDAHIADSAIHGEVASVGVGGGLVKTGTDADPVLTVGTGTGISVAGTTVISNDSEIDHDLLANHDPDQHRVVLHGISDAETAYPQPVAAGTEYQRTTAPYTREISDGAAWQAEGYPVDDATLEVSGGAVQVKDAGIGVAKLSATGTKDATTVLYGDNTFKAAPTGGDGGANTICLGVWTFNGTGTADPGSGNFTAGTSATKSLATSLQFSVTPTDGVADAALLESVKRGDIAYLQKVGDPTGQSHAYRAAISAMVTGGTHLQIADEHLGAVGDAAYSVGDEYCLYVVKSGLPVAYTNLTASAAINNTAYDNFTDTGFTPAPADGKYLLQYSAVATFGAAAQTIDARLGEGLSTFAGWNALANGEYSWTSVSADDTLTVSLIGVVTATAGNYPGVQFKVSSGTVTLTPHSFVMTPVA